MKNQRPTLLFVLGVLVAGCFGCTETKSPCRHLISRLKEQGVYERIVDWVDVNITKERLAGKALSLESGTAEAPMTYRVNCDFDWTLLGMNPSGSEVFIECDAKGDWGAVWLGNLRRAVIIDLKPNWTGKSDEFVYRDRRMIVFCSKD